MRKQHMSGFIFSIAPLFVFAGFLIIYFAGAAIASEGGESNPPEYFNRLVEKAIPGRQVPLESAPSTEWIFHKTVDNLHPDGNEQQKVWLMNRARANPPAEGLWLSNTGDPDIMADIISTGVNVNVMISEFSAIAPKPPAAFDVRLYNAAYQHSLNMIACNCQTHTGQETLVKNSGFDYRLLRGNVFSYAKSAIHCHAALNIDWAGTNNPGDQYGMQPGRGHRIAIMSIDADTYVRKLYNVGIAIIANNGSYPNAGPFVMTGNYAEARDTSWGAPVPNHYNRFIVGTVWRDSNCNGMYNPGEGIANVMVQPDHGKYYAITSNSGGYAIPIESPGNYQVAFSGGFLAGQGKKNVEIGEISVLLDLNTTAPVASFHAAGPTAGSRPFMVAFIDTSGADITSRQWDFGDGTKSTDQNPTHTYTQDGKYSISLMVNTTCGSITETKTNYILVAEQGADVNGDLNINLADAILALQISVNYMGVDIRPDGAPDVNGDAKTGIEEAIYILRWLSR